MKMMKVIFFASWATPQQILDAFRVYTPKGDGIWGQVQGTASVEQSDFYVILDEGCPKLQAGLDSSKFIYMQREPDCIKRVDWSNQRSNFHYWGGFDVLLKAATPWVLKPYTMLKQLQYSPRTLPLVAICSGKTQVVGHRKRLVLLKFLAKHLGPNVFHVYGRGLKARDFNGCYQGELKGKCKFDTLSRYQHCMALENDACPNYVTEKLYDCFLSLCRPIYWGAANVKEYFPDKALVVLDSLDASETVLSTVRSIVSGGITDEMVRALMEAKTQTLDRHNIWPQLERIL